MWCCWEIDGDELTRSDNRSQGRSLDGTIGGLKVDSKAAAIE